MDKKKIIKKIEQLLAKEKKVVFAYLFGSLASGKTNKESDIDVAVFLDCKKEYFFKERINLINHLSKNLEKKTDVIILNRATPFLKFVVLQEGILILDKDESKRIDFDLKSTNEYFDYKPT
jgi:predicted nucleotidyltransferase